MKRELSASLAGFAQLLRSEHGFGVVPLQTHDALRALEIVGIGSRDRARAALRTVYCGSEGEVARFDAIFDTWFSSESPGTPQPAQSSPLGRTKIETPAPEGPIRARMGEAGGDTSGSGESLATAWEAMRARYSPAAGASGGAEIPREGLVAAARVAEELVTRVRLGRALRRRPHREGERLDVRRTLRESLRTGGDVVVLRRLRRPRRNPRFAVLLDGSRSMAECAGPMLQFAYALCRRSRRAGAYLFSTELRDVTRDLREAARDGSFRLESLGEAWGGGTRIGTSLRDFVARFGASLSPQTLAIVISDGLDAGELAPLEDAMRELRRRCAAVAWVNPHASSPGYRPSARAMQAALPYVDVLIGMDDLDSLHRSVRARGY